MYSYVKSIEKLYLAHMSQSLLGSLQDNRLSVVCYRLLGFLKDFSSKTFGQI